jgi:hypothetical protein
MEGSEGKAKRIQGQEFDAFMKTPNGEHRQV